VVEIFALERVGNDGFVLDADLIAEPAARERLDRAFQLPRRRVGRGKREVPGDVVLEDRRLAGRERIGHAAQLEQAIDLREDGIGSDSEDCDLGRHDPWRSGSRPVATTESPAYCWTIDRSPV